MITTNPIVIRHATDADERTLRELASLDTRKPLKGPALVAEVDGVARAAVDLSDGSHAADPFAPTAELVELLHLRAATLVAVNPSARLRARVSGIRHTRAAGARI